MPDRSGSVNAREWVACGCHAPSTARTSSATPRHLGDALVFRVRDPLSCPVSANEAETRVSGIRCIHGAPVVRSSARKCRTSRLCRCRNRRSSHDCRQASNHGARARGRRSSNVIWSRTWQLPPAGVIRRSCCQSLMLSMDDRSRKRRPSSTSAIAMSSYSNGTTPKIRSQLRPRRSPGVTSAMVLPLIGRGTVMRRNGLSSSLMPAGAVTRRHTDAEGAGTRVSRSKVGISADGTAPRNLSRPLARLTRDLLAASRVLADSAAKPLSRCRRRPL
jgi:hypothetical protein